ncbi:hypothetical protein [Nocardia sp. XZ_19_385]|uniref:hypothetical protein n=1 Tax=Nocardia sp. XZ_19_385 TaxID=2769488 RepID=UPI0018909FB7|nr:hypothetical protein [Nocardia sp. XZ_19_385]
MGEIDRAVRGHRPDQAGFGNSRLFTHRTILPVARRDIRTGLTGELPVAITILFRKAFASRHARRKYFMVTNLLNALLNFWGAISPGSSGYSIPPGTLPFGS